MKIANEKTVLGRFEGGIELDGVQYRFARRKEKYIVEIIELDGTQNEYEISYTFGVEPLQQYLVEFPGGKFQALRVSWDTEEKKWFHQYPSSRIDPDDWLHWTRGAQTWNTMCAECHSTDLRKNYNSQKEEFKTTFSEINVGCESCHGMGKKHVDWASNENYSGKSFIDPVGRVQEAQINTCGPCHSRRVKLTSNMKPGLPFEDQFMIQDLDQQYYHPDGQIMEEDYVLGSFLQSRMFHENVMCSDCHNPHNLQLLAIGNNLCYQCHDQSYGSQDHHFHPLSTEATECVNCHMTGKNYMVNDFRRDHSFRIPRPDQSIEYGTPNACNNCHSQKSNEWAAGWIEKWYGKERVENSSDYLTLSGKQRLSQSEKLKIYRFIVDKTKPAIARATVLNNYEKNRDQAEMKLMINLLKDSSALIRSQAAGYFRDYAANERVAVALNLLKDETRLVRIHAAQLVTDQNLNTLKPQDQELIGKGLFELEEMLSANADFPLGRLQLGDYHFQKGEYPNAIHQYEVALKMDPLLSQGYGNLATSYNLNGENEKALTTLNKLINLEPDYAQGYYLRGLLKAEMNQLESAGEDLETAIEKDGEVFRYYYNLAYIKYQNSELWEAKEIIIKGLRIEPTSRDGNALLEMINRDLTG